MNIPAIMLAAPKSGSGKTTITCSMIKAFSNMGKKVRAFKCGPDYIDSMFHREVLGIPSENLDLYFVDKEYVTELVRRDNDSDITIIEGVMGLYDGLGGLIEEASSYHLACALDIPVILVLDAKGMGRSLLAIIHGLLDMDREKRIRGIILNRVSEHFYKELKTLIEKECGISLLGYFQDNKEIRIESRYLGLTLPGEIEGIKDDLNRAADILTDSANLEEILKIAEESKISAHRLVAEESTEPASTQITGGSANKGNPKDGNNIKIAYACDEAFCFYYEENLRLLREAGAELIPFSPIHDDRLPEDIHGIILGGGYPEQYAKQLESNENMRESIKDAIAAGIPSLAECGGFMYLHDRISTKEEKDYRMVGVIPGECRYSGHLVRFGYIELENESASFLPKKERIRGHEFHYYDSSDNGEDAIAVKPVSGRNWRCAHIGSNHWWGFAHLYYGSNGKFAKNFTDACRKWKG